MRRFVIAERIDQLDFRDTRILIRLLESGVADLRKRYNTDIVRTNPALLPDRIIHIGNLSVHISAPAIRPLPVARHDENGIFVVIQISRHRKPELFESVDARDRPRLFPCRIQSRQKRSGDDCDDRNYHKELYKSEFLVFSSEPSIVFRMSLLNSIFHYPNSFF